MGEIIAAGLVSHVPTIMLPKDVRYEIYEGKDCLLYTSPSPRDQRGSRMPSSA